MGGERSWVGAAVLGAGIALGGWFIGHGWTAARTVDRYVSVKGVAEREVTADLALWPFQIVATGNDLTVRVGSTIEYSLRD